MEKQVVITESCHQTEEFAKEFGKTLVGGDIILLQGELGAGKTHFVKGLALALGIDDVITSPTFALHNMYYGKTLVLNHFDFYRVDDSQEVEMLGLHEFFGDRHGVCAIEWWENIADLIPPRHFTVSLEKISDNSRKITITQG